MISFKAIPFVLLSIGIGLLPNPAHAFSSEIDEHSIFAIDQDSQITFLQDLELPGFTTSYFQNGEQKVKAEVDFLRPYCHILLFDQKANLETQTKKFSANSSFTVGLIGGSRHSYELSFEYADGFISFICMAPSWGMFNSNSQLQHLYSTPTIAQFKQIMNGLVKLEVKRIKPFQCTMNYDFHEGWSSTFTETGYTKLDAIKNIYEDCTTKDSGQQYQYDYSLADTSNCKEKIAANQYQCVGI